jgi:hypothetical protein
MTDEELVERLRRYAKMKSMQTERPHMVEVMTEAADRIEALTAENERLNKSAACLAETRRLAVKDVAELEAENERLLQIAQRLGTYSAHDDDCRIMTHGVWSDPIPCTCGYTDAWQAHLTAIRKQP